ncbi:MAG: glycine cleavage system protein GcvH [Limisphaerales bacterium]|jgi:glycine cleavage system H protein|nr:glycine cleavage system protein GcvH [Verrucomicrobiales bacterium]HCB98217.1 glycine cleavage system protein GcvH [Verrucomicrobiales bacterium]|tara:strand:- start:78 stop:464 length:387 start_codon:yes stop_codon:yes gene_type:complete
MSANIPEQLKYAKTHEWVRVEGDTAWVGITDHAQAELTELVFVELPEVGRTVSAGQPCAVVESVKTASDIYAPLSGEVIEVNQALTDDPGKVNADAFGEGWFFKVRMSAPSELDGLMDATSYQSQIGA